MTFAGMGWCGAVCRFRACAHFRCSFTVVLALLLALAVVALRSVQSVVSGPRVSQDSAQATAATDVATTRSARARAQVVQYALSASMDDQHAAQDLVRLDQAIEHNRGAGAAEGQLADLGHPLPRCGGRDHHRDRGRRGRARRTGCRCRDRPRGLVVSSDRGLASTTPSWPLLAAGAGAAQKLVPPMARPRGLLPRALRPS